MQACRHAYGDKHVEGVIGRECKISYMGEAANIGPEHLTIDLKSRLQD